MPAARGVKRTASKSSSTATAAGPKNKKKRGAIQLDIPSAPKKRGRVFTCGQGDVGQLGLGESVVETTKFKFVSTLGDKVVDVCAGGMHTVALDKDGKVWTFGCNDEGALGRTTNGDKDEGTAKAVSLPKKAVAIAAGDSHSAALLDNGDVYAWGAFRDSHGSMGLVVRGREGKACREPVRLDIGETAAGIASGGDHLVVLSTTGSVYTMGCGEQGQLGRLSQRSASRDARQGFSALLAPTKVTLKCGASRVWAGYHATFVLDANNDKVFAWGLNNYGQLGITGEKRKTAIFSPTECDAFTSANASWSWVACGQHHSLALDSNGQVYAIGRTEYGRLGLGDRAGDAEALEPIPKLQNKKCVNIAAGTCNSFAVTDNGEVYAWGMGSEGQLGTGNSSDANEPSPAVSTSFEGLPAKRVAAGGQHTALLLEVESKESSPAPESDKEEADQKTEDSEESQESEENETEKPKARPAKRQKKQDQDEEISSTSAQGSEAKPQKINGDEQKDTPMEVDETDKQEEKKDEESSQSPAEDKQESEEASKQSEDTEPEAIEDTDNKPELMDTSSQETTDSESKNMETSEEPPKTEEIDKKSDSEEKTDNEINGTENETVDSKVESHLQTDNALTTTA